MTLTHFMTNEQGIDDIQERNSTKRFLVCREWQRIFEVLFNGIAVSVWYVSTSLVALHAGLNNQLRRRKII